MMDLAREKEDKRMEEDRKRWEEERWVAKGKEIARTMIAMAMTRALMALRKIALEEEKEKVEAAISMVEEKNQ